MSTPSQANSLESLLQKAESGDSKAQYQLAHAYFLGPEKNYKRSFEWVQKAANQKDVEAITLLAQFYQCGYDVVQIDVIKSAELYKKAADKGNQEALCALALCYRDGDGVVPNKEHYESYLQKAQHHPYAKLNISAKNGVNNAPALSTEDATKYISLIEEQATNGDPNAMFKLGVCYTQGKGVTTDFVTATKWLEKAVAEGHVLAMNNLGMRYIKGEGVKKDVVKATELFRRAASQGNANAYNNLAIRYLKGEAVPQNNELAIEYFTKAAKLGNIQAQINLGDSYRNGDKLKKNLRKAQYWYQLAASSGSQYSHQQIESNSFKNDLQKEIEDADRRWKITRLFFIAQKKKGQIDCPASTLPTEMLKIIVRYADL